MDWHLPTLKLSPRELNHKRRTSSCFWKVTQSVTDLIKKKVFKSSANIKNKESGITNFKPLLIEKKTMEISAPLEEHLKVHRLLQIYILRF